jgi:hypothetical protein
MAVVASATGAAVFGLGAGTLAAGLAGGALLGAGAGALYSGITGDGNILNSALTGALLGGAAGGLGAAFAPAAAGTAAPLTGAGALAPGAATTVNTATPALAAAKGTMAGTAAAPSGIAATQAASGLGLTAPVAGAMPVSTYGTLAGASSPAGIAATQSAAGLGAGTKTAAGLTGNQMLGYGLAGTAALSALGGMNQPKIQAQSSDPGQIRPYTYSSTPTGQSGESPFQTGPLYGADGMPILDTRERRYVNQSYTAGTPYRAAKGGLMDIKRHNNGGITYDPENQKYSGGAAPGAGLTSYDPAMLSQWQAANPNAFSYDPTAQRYSAGRPSQSQYDAYLQEQEEQRMNNLLGSGMMGFFGRAAGFPDFAAGGNVQGYNLGGYSDGGRLLKGPGDGVSDDIPAVIGDRQPARLADGEFVIPARIVSELGNGSTDAGAKRLYAMMDKIQAGRKKTIGKKNVAKDTKAKKHLLA